MPPVTFGTFVREERDDGWYKIMYRDVVEADVRAYIRECERFCPEYNYYLDAYAICKYVYNDVYEIQVTWDPPSTTFYAIIQYRKW